METPAGATLGEVLTSAGFSREYLRDRVQTVFLDGSVVDDLDSEVISAGSVIALSAALPGVAGAIFRKDSPISEMRSRTATRKDTPDCGGHERVLATLKLFNQVAEEMGPTLMRNGIIVNRSDLLEELTRRSKVFENAILRAELDGKTVSPTALLSGDLPDREQILLQVTWEENER